MLSITSAKCHKSTMQAKQQSTMIWSTAMVKSSRRRAPRWSKMAWQVSLREEMCLGKSVQLVGLTEPKVSSSRKQVNGSAHAHASANKSSCSMLSTSSALRAWVEV